MTGSWCVARRSGLAAALVIVLGQSLAAMAQGREAGTAAAPDVRSMIESLMPSSESRSRNLLVRERPEVAASAAAAAAPDAQAASAAAPAAAPVSADPSAVPPSLSLAIQFEPDSATVRPQSGTVLGNLVAALQSPELRGSRFAIEGHTDATGPAARNQQLSQQRADEVRLFLVALGVHPSRLRAVGKGSSEPVNPDDPRAAENRRVRVVPLP